MNERLPPEQRFKAGDIIRYTEGPYSLFRYDGTHKRGRLNGEHVLGASHTATDFDYGELVPANETDLAYCRKRRPDWFSLPSPST